MKVSIIMATRDRARALEKTLRALGAARIPDDVQPELLIVDNGSTDDTKRVVESAPLHSMAIRYIFARPGGQSAGRNRGLALADGDVILFLDDDVRPAADWLEGMCAPFRENRAQAAAGGVELAPHLLRPWMTLLHRSWLASSEWLHPQRPQSMVGANMAFSRSVLARVPQFDPELGPGALGFGEDSLFASQLLAAGYTIHDCRHARVEHHFDPQRLTREAWLNAAKRRGRVLAYRGHHWEHWGCKLARPRLWRSARALQKLRLSHPDNAEAEGCSEAELRLVLRHAQYEAHLRERKRSRLYRRHGFVRLGRSENLLGSPVSVMN